jgi:Spy/CpxP family protein refolding chaperone
MSTQSPVRVIKPVAPTQIGDTIALTDAQEAQIRRIIREEMREFLLAQRRAAKYVDSVVVEQLGLITN